MAVRRVRRIVRRIDPWTVLKVSLVFNAIAALIFVLGTWVIWSLSLQRGIPERLVEIFERVTLTLTIDGELYFRVIVLLAVVGAIVLTGLFTLGAVLYNLIADLVGGVELTVLEETYNPNPEGTRTVLRPVVRTPVAQTAGQPPPELVPEEAAPPGEAAGGEEPDEDEPISDPDHDAAEVPEDVPHEEPVPVAVADDDREGEAESAGGEAEAGVAEVDAADAAEAVAVDSSGNGAPQVVGDTESEVEDPAPTV